MQPILLLLGFASVAALAAALGALPLVGHLEPPRRWLGWANAVAAGMMLGSAYALTTPIAQSIPLIGGAAAGILATHFSHLVLGTAGLELNLLASRDPTYGYRIFMIGTLHSAVEGVALGAAMVVGTTFGLFLAIAFAVHNVAEAGVLIAVLRGQGLRLHQGAGLAVVANTTQVLLAIVVYALVHAAPAALPWAAGFAMGGMINLVLVELLPESYRQAGRTSIAVVGALALATVLLVQGLLA